MAEQAKSENLVDDVLSGRIDRRQLFIRAAALGIAVPGILALQAAPGVAQDRQHRRGGAGEVVSFPDPFLDPNAKTGRHVPGDHGRRPAIARYSRDSARPITQCDGERLRYAHLSRCRRSQLHDQGTPGQSWQFTSPTTLDFNLPKASPSTMGRISRPKTSSGQSNMSKIPTLPRRTRRVDRNRNRRSRRSADGAIPPQAALAGNACRSLDDPDLFRRPQRTIRSRPNRMAPVPSCGRNMCLATISRSSRTRITG